MGYPWRSETRQGPLVASPLFVNLVWSFGGNPHAVCMSTQHSYTKVSTLSAVFPYTCLDVCFHSGQHDAAQYCSCRVILMFIRKCIGKYIPALLWGVLALPPVSLPGSIDREHQKSPLFQSRRGVPSSILSCAPSSNSLSLSLDI